MVRRHDERVLTVADYFREVIPRVYMTVMRELLTDDELATLRLSIRAAPGRYALDADAALPADAVIGTGEELLVVEVHGEVLNAWLASAMTDEENSEQFYSVLQDWISETTFGWGQLRGHM